MTKNTSYFNSFTRLQLAEIFRTTDDIQHKTHANISPFQLYPYTGASSVSVVSLLHGFYRHTARETKWFTEMISTLEMLIQACLITQHELELVGAAVSPYSCQLYDSSVSRCQSLLATHRSNTSSPLVEFGSIMSLATDGSIRNRPATVGGKRTIEKTGFEDVGIYEHSTVVTPSDVITESKVKQETARLDKQQKD